MFLLGLWLEQLLREHPEAKDLPAILGRAGRRYEGVLYDEVDDGILLLGRGVATRTEALQQDVLLTISMAVPHEEDDGLREWAFQEPVTCDTVGRTEGRFVNCCDRFDAASGISCLRGHPC